MSKPLDSMINVPMDGREIELLKQLLTKACEDEYPEFRIAQYNLLFNKLTTYKRMHHENHAGEIMKRFETDSSVFKKGES